MASVVLDTSVLIALFRIDDPHHESAVKATSARNEYSISAITLSEALISPFRINSQSGQKYYQLVSKTLHQIISVDEEIALLGAQIRADNKLSLPDALISATAYSKKAQLWSCDRDLVKSHRGAVLI